MRKLIISISLLFLSVSSHASTIILKNGSVITGDITYISEDLQKYHVNVVINNVRVGGILKLRVQEIEHITLDKEEFKEAKVKIWTQEELEETNAAIARRRKRVVEVDKEWLLAGQEQVRAEVKRAERIMSNTLNRIREREDNRERLATEYRYKKDLIKYSKELGITPTIKIIEQSKKEN